MLGSTSEYLASHARYPLLVLRRQASSDPEIRRSAERRPDRRDRVSLIVPYLGLTGSYYGSCGLAARSEGAYAAGPTADEPRRSTPQ
jgi:hypothetical protein